MTNLYDTTVIHILYRDDMSDVDLGHIMTQFGNFRSATVLHLSYLLRVLYVLLRHMLNRTKDADSLRKWHRSFKLKSDGETATSFSELKMI
jgi:hypothetical protein